MTNRDKVIAEWRHNKAIVPDRGLDIVPITIDDLAKKYGVHRIDVKKWIEAEDSKQLNDDVIEVVRGTDPSVVSEVIEGLKEKSRLLDPLAKSTKIVAQLNNLEDGLEGLALVDSKFHSTIMNLLAWADEHITDDMDLNTWKIVTEHVGKLHTAIFSRGGQTVQIMQNNSNNGGSNSSVDRFKGSYKS